jgi:hypothetical protein
MKGAALFLGNDVHAVSGGYSWHKLIVDLIEYVGAQSSITPTKSHFPLLYEEIRAYSVNGRKKTESAIKEFIAERVKGLEGNDIHEKLLDLPFEHYLTTNYDFALERKANLPIKDLINDGKVGETRYSLFRKYRFKSKHLWHIHGEAKSAQTIALGFEQYSGYLQQMRNYVVSGTRGAYKNFRKAALVERLRKGEREINSWVDLFFLRDIHVVGFSYDLAEMHLWWLLTFRARRGREFWDKKLRIKNRIIYYVPSYYDLEGDAKIRFLRSLDVEVRKIEAEDGNKRDYYEAVLEQIGSALGV